MAGKCGIGRSCNPCKRMRVHGLSSTRTLEGRLFPFRRKDVKYDGSRLGFLLCCFIPQNTTSILKGRLVSNGIELRSSVWLRRLVDPSYFIFVEIKFQVQLRLEHVLKSIERQVMIANALVGEVFENLL